MLKATIEASRKVKKKKGEQVKGGGFGVQTPFTCSKQEGTSNEVSSCFVSRKG